MAFKVIRPGDVHWIEIEMAKNFIRKPLSEGFKAWSTLRDSDNVTMTIQELGHLMAWYAMVRMETRLVNEKPMSLDPPLPEPSNREVKFLYIPLDEETRNG
jgi:hypothetical protein